MPGPKTSAAFTGFIVLLLGGTALAQTPEDPNAPNPKAVESVAQGARQEANAAWWGFNAEDATSALQSAIDSKARTVIVPYMGKPWIVTPIKLRSDLKLIFEPGVLVLAKKGEFKGRGDSLFRAVDMTDIHVRGYGATLRMRKADYQSAAYEKAEWRMGFSFTGCKRVTVEGVRVESTGGDGFYIGATKDNPWCEDVTIRDCVGYDNHRQGISVISAVNLLVENCEFSKTSGTAPQAGIDLEPNHATDRLVNCVISNCTFQDNAGDGIEIYLRPLTSESEPVSIRFENCVARLGTPGMTLADFTDIGQRAGAGINVAALGDNGPKGTIEFINCTTENTGAESLRIADKSAASALVRFVNCNLKQPWVCTSRGYGGPRVPILIRGRRAPVAKDIGGIEFDRCHVYDEAARPAVVADLGDEMTLRDVGGTVFAGNARNAEIHLGPEAGKNSLQVIGTTH